jgi:hypothetical protein
MMDAFLFHTDARVHFSLAKEGTGTNTAVCRKVSHLAAFKDSHITQAAAHTIKSIVMELR